MPVVKTAQCAKSVDSSEDVSLNGLLFASYIGLFFIFFNRSKASAWHIYFLDSILASMLVGEALFVSSSNDYSKVLGRVK